MVLGEDLGPGRCPAGGPPAAGTADREGRLTPARHDARQVNGGNGTDRSLAPIIGAGPENLHIEVKCDGSAHMGGT